MRDIVLQNRIHVPTLFGGLSQREKDGKVVPYNTAFMTDADGSIIGTYDKTYLLAFGEYIPLGDTFPVLYEISPNSGHFTPGDQSAGLPPIGRGSTAHDSPASSVVSARANSPAGGRMSGPMRVARSSAGPTGRLVTASTS